MTEQSERHYTERYFVDTNLLLYAKDRRHPDKQRAAAAWLDWLWRHGTGRLSTQVLNEYYVVATQKLQPALLREDAQRDVRALMHWHPYPINLAVIDRAFALQADYQLSYWDALIIAAAKLSHCQYLLTEDQQSSAELEGVQIIDPFQQPVPD